MSASSLVRIVDIGLVDAGDHGRKTSKYFFEPKNPGSRVSAAGLLKKYNAVYMPGSISASPTLWRKMYHTMVDARDETEKDFEALRCGAYNMEGGEVGE